MRGEPLPVCGRSAPAPCLDAMGSNRRYGSDLTLGAFAEVAMRPTPRTLGPAQVGDRITKAPVPGRVLA